MTQQRGAEAKGFTLNQYNYNNITINNFQNIDNNGNWSLNIQGPIQQNEQLIPLQIDISKCEEQLSINKQNKSINIKDIKEYIKGLKETWKVSGSSVFAVGTIADAGIHNSVLWIPDKTFEKVVTTVVHWAEKLFDGLLTAGDTVISVIASGLSFLIKFFVEWIILYHKKNANQFSKNNKNNKTIYNSYWNKSFFSNLGGFVAATGVSIAIGFILTVGWPIIVATIFSYVVGCFVRWGIRKIFDWYEMGKQYYDALNVLRVRGIHDTITKEIIEEKFKQEKKAYQDNLETKKRMKKLEESKQLLFTYVEMRDKDNGLLKDKVEYYIQQRSKEVDCIIL